MLALLLAAAVLATSPVVVAVPGLDAHGVAPELAASLTTVVLTRLGRVDGALPTSPDDLQRLLAEEQRRQLVGCGKDTQCVSRIVGIVDAQRMVTGSVGRVGERFIVTLTLLDVLENRLLRRVTREVSDEAALVEAAASATDALWLTPDAPAEACLDCGGDRDIELSVLLGNNFMTFFDRGVDVSLIGPGLTLGVGRRMWRWVTLHLDTGLSLGKSDIATADDVRFQIVPLRVGARLWHQLDEALAANVDLSLGMSFVRTAAASEDVSHIDSAFAGRVALGLERHLSGGFGLLVEASYGLTVRTPETLRNKRLNTAALQLGVGYAF